MSGNTSATGGFIGPDTSPAVLEDPQLTDLLQALVVGITGIAGTLVRPRWQPTPPDQPAASVDWCAIGVMRRTNEDGLSYMGHEPGDEETPATDVMQRHQVLEVLASFYGPNAAALADRLVDGLMVGQNRETLAANDAGLADIDREILTTSELVNARWIERQDATFRIRRQRRRAYPVLNMADAPFNLVGDPT